LRTRRETQLFRSTRLSARAGRAMFRFGCPYEVSKMPTIDHARFDARQLGDLLERATSSEKDFRHRLEARLRQRAGTGDAAPVADPVARRLAFLHAKAQNERRAVERALALRLRAEGRQSAPISTRTCAAAQRASAGSA
jgi:hypothetical protein